MALIYSSFAQIKENELPGLIGEYTALMDYFNSRQVKQKADFQVAYGKDVNELTSALIAHQKNLSLFHFSGHSDHDGLDFQDEDFSTEHFSRFFNTLNDGKGQLDCVFLNGCSNAAIVNQLHNVPVVIGSKSPILNKDAIKFTGDFFKALVSGNKSYQESFNQAFSALPDFGGQSSIVRGIKLLDPEPVLNDYFMVINNQKVAERGIPLKRSWKKILFSGLLFISILLTILGSIWTFLKWEDISKTAKGYDCPEWAEEDKDKCKVFVTDFNIAEANTFIKDGINLNDKLNKYLNAKSDSFDEMVVDKSLTHEKFRELCTIDYIVTGAVNEKRTKISIELIPEIKTKQIRQILLIEELFELRMTIRDLDDIDNNNFIISKLCLACASSDPSYLFAIDAQLDLLEGIPGAEEELQQTAEEAATIALDLRDTSKAIQYLERMAYIDDNDKTLAAIEGKSILETQTQQYNAAYKSQSNYLNAVGNRLKAPEDFTMLEPDSNYVIAQYSMMERRANLVYDHPLQLGFANEQAINDFRYLKSIGNSTQYDSKIKELCQRIGADCNDEEEKEAKPVVLKIRRNQGGAPIINAVATYNNQVFTANNNGLISIPCPDEDCIDKPVAITARGFEPLDTDIKRVEGGHRITLKRSAIPPQQKTMDILVSGPRNIVAKEAKAALNNRIYDADRGGKITIPCEDGDCKGKVIIISAPGYEDKSSTISETTAVMKVRLVKAKEAPPVPDKTIKILVLDRKDDPITRAVVTFNNKSFRTNNNGFATIPCKDDNCLRKRINVAATGYEDQTATITQTTNAIKVLLVKTPVSEKSIIILVQDSKKNPITRAIVSYNNRSYTTDNKGEVTIPCKDNNCFSKAIKVAATGYEDQNTSITRDVMTINMKTKPEPPTITSITGEVKNQDQRPLQGAQIDVNGELLTSNQTGKFTFKCEPTKYNSTFVTISKKGYEPKKIRVSELIEIRTVILTSSVPVITELNYTIFGNLKDCKFRNSIISSVDINGKTVKVIANARQSTYTYKITSKPGKKVTIKPQRGFKFSNNKDATFELGTQESIKKDFTIEEAEPTGYSVGGKILFDGKPALEAAVSISGTNSEGMVWENGQFELSTPDYLCRYLVVKFRENPEKRYELRKFIKGTEIFVEVDLTK